MSTPNILIESVLAQAPVKSNASASPAPVTTPKTQSSGQIWLYTSIVLVLLLIGLAVYGKLQLNDMAKKLKFEQFKTIDLQKS
jgi:hypothetical protein